ncbi:universal stress protein [Nocardia aurantiaca]|nr:universal stress protein [Nocardia aurantiaca]
MPTNDVDQPIIVGMDMSAAALRAVRWAAHDAVLRGAPLQLVCATPRLADRPLDDSPVELFHSDYRDTVQTTLEDAADLAKSSTADLGSLDVSTLIVDAEPIPVLCELAQTARYVVVGARGLTSYHRSLLGSVSTALARHALGPVVIVPEELPDASLPVVVGVDGSPLSTHAIEVAFDEASRRGVEVVAVHAWGDRTRDPVYSASDAHDLLARSLSAPIAEYPNVKVWSVVAEGRPLRQLLEESRRAQLIVIGSHGRGGFPGMTLGSTGEAVMHAADCPVAIIRPREAG